ncbi:MAG: NDP-hexose 2,3-dehydratase family protein [Nitrospiraceae bacterium]|nr:NDP-hexose 2,3-dehydratase family protein [Nitrospiraceae bacterium]
MSDLTGDPEMGRLLSELAAPPDLFGTIRANLIREQACGLFPDEEDGNSLRDIVQWLDDERASNHIRAERQGLSSLSEWGMDGEGFFSHKEKKFFQVVGLKVTSPYREVGTWSQPILDNAGTGLVGLLIRRAGDRTYFLMQAKPDVGNRNVVQLGPTVQFNPGNYIDNKKIRKPFLFDDFLHDRGFVPVMTSRQSEEGGRFYKEEQVHKILLLQGGRDLALPSSHRWLSSGQVRFFLHLGDVVNSSARSILACLL